MWVVSAEVAGDEGDGGVDPEDGEDAGEAMKEEDSGVAGMAEFSCSDGSDDHAADDEEEVDAEGAVFEEAQMICGEVFCFDAVKVGQDNKESCKSATDLNAN